MTREELVDELRDALSDACDMDVTFGMYADAAVRCLEKHGIIRFQSDARRLAYDEGAMDIVAKAIYCAARPDLATMWHAECQETRRHYLDLASDAFLASLRVMKDTTNADR